MRAPHAVQQLAALSVVLALLLLTPADASRLPEFITSLFQQRSPDAAASSSTPPPPPNFPDAYEMEYTFSMPYFLLLQPGGLSYKVHVWVDKARESVRIDFRGGIDKTYFIGDKEYSVTPHNHDLVCREYEHGGGPIKRQAGGGGSGSSNGMPAGMLGKQVLPDLTPWEDMGPAEVDDTDARMYQLKNMAGEKTNTYTFYVGKDGTPLKLHSVGQDFFQGSHYDEYLYMWSSFKPGPVDPSVFDLPQICKDLPPTTTTSKVKKQEGDTDKGERQEGEREEEEEEEERAAAAATSGGGGVVLARDGGAGGRHHQVMQAIALLPGNHPEHADEAHYHLHAAFHGRTHDCTHTYNKRLSAFSTNKAKNLAHNKRATSSGAQKPQSSAATQTAKAASAATGGPEKSESEGVGVVSHTLELNHFADWDRDEFDRVMLPLKWRRDHGYEVQKVRPAPLRTFQSTMTKEQLPKKLDWRGTPADFAVKDQGQCGSCWAFAAVGTMEGSFFTATGKSRSFSEQQLIDCAWPEGPHGCDGGDYQPGFRYVAKAGIATTQDYPYVGNNDYCRDDTTKMTGHFEGYVEVPSKDEVAVMEALYKHGPLAVGVDASFDEFLFYSEGVYRDKRCALKPSRLNHAVILVGWGTDRDFGDYWIVKNSWSKLWGNDGYIKIHRGGNDCGIASDAAFAEVSPQHVVPGAAERARALVLAASNDA